MTTRPRPTEATVALPAGEIHLRNAHGVFAIDSLRLSATIARYLPASPADLRRILAERTGDPTYADHDEFSEMLVMLADMDAEAAAR